MRVALPADWRWVAILRRSALTGLIFVPALIATRYMMEVLPRHGGDALELAIAAVFGVLFAWISAGFWTALVGFGVLMRDRDRFSISRSIAGRIELDPRARTALVMPVCNEDARSVFARLRATFESLHATPCLANFDFYVLSDSTDPDRWVEEEVAWAELRRDLGVEGRVFYRHRRLNIKRKSGNIADFCRRWGLNYRYMVVLDADSVMSGDTLGRLVALMEANRDVGILQTLPCAVNGETLLARLQQFANRVYGPVFAAGLNYWQLGDGHYWGHNCIIRIAPFMRHCALPRLPGRPPLGGEILSHDFVEAFLMRRAGWKVWLAYELGGSYEETPPTVLDELARDRRWCQGNLQHTRLLLEPGMSAFQRFLFLTGIMAYVTPALWCTLLLLGGLEVVLDRLRVPVYFAVPSDLFPAWPISHPDLASIILIGTSIALFLPRLLGIVHVVIRRPVGDYGGPIRLLVGVFLEALVSMLLAPVRMLFHGKFALLTLLGRVVHWTAQRRDNHRTRFIEALRAHGTGTVIAALWSAAAFTINAAYFWWLTPVLGGLILAVPLSMLTSSVAAGRRARRWGLFVIPEETRPPRELCWRVHASASDEPVLNSAPGFVRAVADPYVNALHIALLGGRGPHPARSRHEVMAKAVSDGPFALSRAEKMQLLNAPANLAALHVEVWAQSAEGDTAAWGIAARADKSIARPAL
jgi:membrane glycosyltransferase